MTEVLNFCVDLLYSLLNWGSDVLVALQQERLILGQNMTILEIMFGFGIGLFIVRVLNPFN